MEKRRVILTIVFVVWLLALIFTFYYLYTIYRDISAPQSIPAKLDSQYVELYTLTPITPDNLLLGQDVNVTKNDIIPVSVKNEDYSIKVFEVNNSNKKVDLIVNNFLYFSLSNGETKKLDFNGDNYYDILITLKDVNDNHATLFVKSINEKKAVEDNLNEALLTIQKNSAIQSKLVISIALIFIILLVIYFVKVYLAPAIKTKRRTEREKPGNVMDYLIDEFNDLKSSGKTGEARKILNKAKNLYSHMSENDKKIFKSKIKSMEKYIN